MQYISSPEGDNLCRSLPVMTSRPLSPGYSLLAFVMFLVLLLPTPSPIPSPAPPAVTGALIIKTVTHYLDLVLVEERYKEAYTLLSTEVQAGEPFADFVKNSNYTLLGGCWKIGDIKATPLDSQRGIANIQLTQVSCNDDSAITYDDWEIHVQWQQDHLVIVSIGLYPAAPVS